MFYHVLPVLLLEFLALSITRAVIPTLLLQTFSHNIYFVMGCAECVRGLLAFVSCPAFGKMSDVLGRKACLFVTVLGTCGPVCSLAIISLYYDLCDYYERQHGEPSKYSDNDQYQYMNAGLSGGGTSEHDSNKIDMMNVHTNHYASVDPTSYMDREHRKVYIFVFLLAVSGIFSSTFTLTFAYISDTVKQKSDRVTAYGLALATFGLSYTIGPMLGGYLANSHVYIETNAMEDGTEAEIEQNGLNRIEAEDSDGSHYLHPAGQQMVFCTSLVLTILDLLYIYFILPESIPQSSMSASRYRYSSPQSSPQRPIYRNDDHHDDNISVITTDTRTSTSIAEQWNHIKEIVPNVWSPLDTLRIFSGDPFLYEVGYIAFFYYTSLWAVVSTLTLYAVKRFHMSPARLGELMSALGLSTMLSEAVLVRVIVPALGEKRAIRVGLLAFAAQCAVLGFAYRGWHLFVCVLFSMVANLVYPSLTSLVSSAVAPDMVGEALGAVNGIKALTEGVGPLVFGTLMTFSEHSMLPGWPYFLAAILALTAYRRGARLPDENDEDYLSERYLSQNSSYSPNSFEGGGGGRDTLKNKNKGRLSQWLSSSFSTKSNRYDGDSALTEMQSFGEDEYMGLLSEVEGVDEDELLRTNREIMSSSDVVDDTDDARSVH